MKRFPNKRVLLMLENAYTWLQKAEKVTNEHGMTDKGHDIAKTRDEVGYLIEEIRKWSM